MTNWDNNPLNPPKNKNLPFFAYGIFKPGQIAYSRIKDCVETYNEKEIDYEMLMRDGVPLIIPQGSHKKTIGNLIYFYDEDCEKAYEIISKTHYEKLYKWEEIDVGQDKANVLMGVNPEMGSYHIDGNVGHYDGRNDPYFKEAIKVVENELNDKDKKESDSNNFFKLQMSYLLLWTAIERYCSLKYNCKEIIDKRRQLSKEDAFKKSLKENVKDKRTIYSADKLREYTLNPNEPFYCINYYYTVRCNVTHRGKNGFKNDYEILSESLKELFAIFNDILDDTFDET